MSVTTRFQKGFQKLLDKAGTQVQIRYFDETIGSVWDDEVTLTLNSDTWTSGIVLPVRGVRGSNESVLIEQGKLKQEDIKLFVSGSIDFTDMGSIVRIGIGSPANTFYKPVPIGIRKLSVYGNDLYKKGYFREITGTGSYLGE